MNLGLVWVYKVWNGAVFCTCLGVFLGEWVSSGSARDGMGLFLYLSWVCVDEWVLSESESNEMGLFLYLSGAYDAEWVLSGSARDGMGLTSYLFSVKVG